MHKCKTRNRIFYYLAQPLGQEGIHIHDIAKQRSIQFVQHLRYFFGHPRYAELVPAVITSILSGNHDGVQGKAAGIEVRGEDGGLLLGDVADGSELGLRLRLGSIANITTCTMIVTLLLHLLITLLCALLCTLLCSLHTIANPYGPPIILVLGLSLQFQLLAALLEQLIKEDGGIVVGVGLEVVFVELSAAKS